MKGNGRSIAESIFGCQALQWSPAVQSMSISSVRNQSTAQIDIDRVINSDCLSTLDGDDGTNANWQGKCGEQQSLFAYLYVHHL